MVAPFDARLQLRFNFTTGDCMALKDVTRNGVEQALDEFDRINLDGMIEKYGGGGSTKWYIQRLDHQSGRKRLYDQKVVLRAAHQHDGFGPLPAGPGTFTAGRAQKRLKQLGYLVVAISSTAEGAGKH